MVGCCTKKKSEYKISFRNTIIDCAVSPLTCSCPHLYTQDMLLFALEYHGQLWEKLLGNHLGNCKHFIYQRLLFPFLFPTLESFFLTGLGGEDTLHCTSFLLKQCVHCWCITKRPLTYPHNGSNETGWGPETSTEYHHSCQRWVGGVSNSTLFSSLDR